MKKMKLSPAGLFTLALILLVPAWRAGAASPLYISVDALRHAAGPNRPVIVADVRNRGAYDALHIPGAVHVPLHAVKTSSLLKSGTCVLVNDGFAVSRLAEECRALKTAGHDVAVLRGGFNAWLEKNLSVAGDAFAAADVCLAEPAEVFMELQARSFLPVNASGRGEETIFPGEVGLAAADKDSLELLRQYNRSHPDGSVLVFNDDGRDYPAVRKKLLAAGVRQLFFLKGGLNAYKAYLQNLEWSRAPREERLKSFNKCRSCGD